MSDENKDFAEIYLRCYGKVYSYISRMLGLDSCEAEDLTQQVFLIAYRKWDTLQEHPNVPAFLMRVAKNLILKHSVTRRPLCFNQLEILETAVADSREDRTYEMAELYMDIAHVLPKEQMTQFCQYYVNGFTAEEIASRLGIQTSCFKRRIARMKERLRNELTGNF